jgi:hypothetical protein
MLASMRRHSSFPPRQRLNPSGLLIIALFCGGLGRSQTLTDNFSGYAAGSDAAPTWEPQAAGWTVIDGSYQGEEGASVWRAAPWVASARIACDLTVLEPLSGDWLTAGIGLQMDGRNYWALNLVVAPESQQRRHSTEMQEMLQGVWLAQAQTSTKLEQLPTRGAGLDWRVGQTYRFEVELTASKIVGLIRQGTEEVSRFGYRLDRPGPAVRLGLPMLRASGLKARFDNAAVTVTKSAAEPPAEPKKIVTWVSRPGPINHDTVADVLSIRVIRVIRGQRKYIDTAKRPNSPHIRFFQEGRPKRAASSAIVPRGPTPWPSARSGSWQSPCRYAGGPLP